MTEIRGFDAIFIGTGFRERIELMNAIDWTGINLGLFGTWNLMGSRSKLRQYVQSVEPIPNRAAILLYRASKVGLNLYRTSQGFGMDALKIDHAESLNPRAYELAACGVFQVSDYRYEVEEVFGDSIPTFSTPVELEAIIRRALAEPEWRSDCAQRSRQMVRDHTFDARASLLIETLNRVARDRALRIVSRDGIGPCAEVMA